jgi:hypothetical protein
MTHISNLGAGIYSDLAVTHPTANIAQATLDAAKTAVALQAFFGAEIANVGGTRAANTFVRIQNVREFPSIGSPANIVNVPVYGQATSSQVNGQADAPTLEMTLNYVATDWGKDTTAHLAAMVGDGVSRCFRFTLLNALPTTYASTTGGLGTVGNTQYYWIGKIEALLVNPQLTDANTATLTLSIQGAFLGAFTST